MLLSCKRVASYDDILEPVWKRYRLDAPMPGPDYDRYDRSGLTGGVGSSCLDPCADRRRQPDLLQEPTLKRLRLGLPEAAGDGAAGAGAGGNSQEEAQLRGWAQAIVGALHGCPSVEEAAQRCSRALLEFGQEVRQAALREAESAREEAEEEAAPEMQPSTEDRLPEGAGQNLQHTNKVLMRAVHHLAERCRRLEASAAEVPALQQALEQSQEAQRRLAHSNEVLQEHLKVHLNACR